MWIHRSRRPRFTRHVNEEVIGSLTYQVSLEMALETAHGLTDGAG